MIKWCLNNEGGYMGAEAVREARPSASTNDQSKACILPLKKTIGQLKLAKKAGQLIFNLPGNGKERDECGDFKSEIYCDKHKQLNRIVTRRSCKRLQCPVCRDSAILRITKRITEKVQRAEHLFNKEGANLGPIRHIILSPPEGEWTNRINTIADYKRLRKKATYRLREAGARGAVVIYHHYRFDDTGIPYASPHYHCLAYGWLIPAGDFYDGTGWIYKNKGTRDSLHSTIEYQLSHCGILDGSTDAYTYTGILSSRYVVKDGPEIIEKEPMMCDHVDCDEQLNHHCEDGTVLEPAFFTYRLQKYKLKKHLIIQADIIRFTKKIKM